MVTKTKMVPPSPKAPKHLKTSKMKITNLQRRKLKALKKDDLHKLAKLAGAPDEPTMTKADLAHSLSRNQKFAAALLAAGSFSFGSLVTYLKMRPKAKKPYTPYQLGPRSLLSYRLHDVEEEESED
jgi:hypothetical protein